MSRYKTRLVITRDDRGKDVVFPLPIEISYNPSFRKYIAQTECFTSFVDEAVSKYGVGGSVRELLDEERVRALEDVLSIVGERIKHSYSNTDFNDGYYVACVDIKNATTDLKWRKA